MTTFPHTTAHRTHRRLAILGSTGSIGQSTLRVIDDHPGAFQVVAIAAHSSIDDLEAQFHKYMPAFIGVVDETAGRRLKEKLKDESVEVVIGQRDLVSLAGLSGVDLVLNAVVGAAGLQASLEAVRSGKLLALANKESLVAGGPLFPSLMERSGSVILPVDSEHSAIWQALRAGNKEEVAKIILTASGGPFRDYPVEKFGDITVEQALAHPTWKMGAKITIDSATMVNKGLEVIEAVMLFDVPPSDIQVVIHPQSVIHSMVEYRDSSVIAQMSMPDMCLPIAYALFWPERPASPHGRIDWNQLTQLTFEQPDYRRFPGLKLAQEVAGIGGTAPAVFNAANEVAVASFLESGIRFTTIADTIKEAVESVPVNTRPTLDDILDADRQAREVARKFTESKAC
ncbi:1-deoxy-D-xylulose-5-phosphate reductoisomerase [candidate division GN15 bacterium]|nr:1-deoxy-D-xylulose-5-phosphate reductoisomerase [candidate division GN15 bacterium]